MKKFLVTGGAGFIGSNLVDALLEKGFEVRVLDDFSSGLRENLRHLDSQIEIVEGDVGDPEVCRRAVTGCSGIFHLAAMVSVQKTIGEPTRSHYVNLDSTLNLLVAAREAGARRFVFASSAAIYGNSPDLPKIETMRPEPLSPYAVQKLAGEHYLKVFHDLYGLETLALRFFNVFGPRQNPGSDYAAVIPKFIALMLAGKQPTIFGDGHQTRDFIHVSEVVRALIQAGTLNGIGGFVCNVAGGEKTDLIQLVGTINRILGTRLEPTFGPAAPGDVRDSLADVAHARRVLDFTPQVSFEEGLRRTIDWYKSHPSLHG